ncbi:homB domain protein [Helicobacter pylori NQ4076]|uniref:HomB domain protein n=1 Tax=Helicobacter pylori NQ4076 TaxID=992029 RepID=I9QJW5_HELPX|nr:homB domain protein [Helicobacter pylori NQ4076]
MPYNLSNVKLSFTDAQGNAIDLGVIETIPKHSKIVLPGEAFDSLKEAFDKISPYTFFFQNLKPLALLFLTLTRKGCLKRSIRLRQI